MEIQQVNSYVWIVRGSVNMGLVKTEDGLVAVDTGLDKQAGKNLLKAAVEIGEPVCAIVNTHAHADHFGGNALVLRQHAIPVYAPKDEAAIIRRPSFEPEYLWQGANPFPELQNKFLLAKSSPVDVEVEGEPFTIGGVVFEPIALPGHSQAQIGIRVRQVMFAADAYFDIAVTDKHGLPFLVDVGRAMASADRLMTVTADWYVPGHGQPSTNPLPDVQYLLQRHRDGMAKLLDLTGDPLGLDEIVAAMCSAFALHMPASGSYLLLRTTVAAYITECILQKTLEVVMEPGKLCFRATK